MLKNIRKSLSRRRNRKLRPLAKRTLTFEHLQSRELMAADLGVADPGVNELLWDGYVPPEEHSLDTLIEEVASVAFSTVVEKVINRGVPNERRDASSDRP